SAEHLPAARVHDRLQPDDARRRRTVRRRGRARRPVPRPVPVHRSRSGHELCGGQPHRRTPHGHRSGPHHRDRVDVRRHPRRARWSSARRVQLLHAIHARAQCPACLCRGAARRHGQHRRRRVGVDRRRVGSWHCPDAGQLRAGVGGDRGGHRSSRFRRHGDAWSQIRARRQRRLPVRRWAGPVRWWHVAAVWALIYLPVFPRHHLLPSVSQKYVLDANIAFEYTLVAFSLVLLTGWVGQISLGQAAFVGVGAFSSSLLTNKAGIPFPANLPLAGAAAAAIAVLLGMVALRVRGLYLAVATLIFAWICDSYLFSAAWFTGEGGGTSVAAPKVGRPGGVTVFDFSNDRIIYLVLLAAVLLCWMLLINLRDSKTGRAFFAIRGSETAAVSLGIDVIRYKLLAFAVSGALAGVAGNLMLLSDHGVSSDTFQFKW